MNPFRIWITGAGGLIGHELKQLLSRAEEDLEVISLTRRDLDLTEESTVQRRLRHDRPQLIFHCAGLTRGPACDADPGRARVNNVEVTQHLTEAAGEAVIVFFSTDLVFDGARGGYTEQDEPHPLGAYGETKLEAERVVLKDPRHLVIRTSLNYGHSPTGDRSFNEDMLRAVRGGARMRLFTDEYRCPIASTVLARAAWELGRAAVLAEEARRPRGLFHVAGAERLSRWEIGNLLTSLHPELQGRLEPCSLVEYKGAPRSPDTSLNSSKAQRHLSFPLPAFSAWIAQQRPDE
jgi:dTDP-4-dehydrorhamnose reductase